MDLTRLYNLTTPELRQEAERLGVSDTYAMSRGQLIHAIRDRASGGQQSEGFFGKVLGFARWAIQAAQEEPRKEAVGQPPGGEAPAREAKRFGRPAEAPMPSVGAASTTRSASVPGQASGRAAASAGLGEPENVPESENGTAHPIGSDDEPAPPSEPAAGPPSRPPVGVFSKTASTFEEPFPTLTMARILAEQGHFKRSLAIYATLQGDEPENRELRAEADEVRAQSRARRSEIL